MTLDLLEVTIIVASNLIILIAFIWRLSAKYGELRHAIQQNKDDINRLGNSLREETRTKNNWQDRAIQHIQEHLERTENYHPPTFW